MEFGYIGKKVRERLSEDAQSDISPWKLHQDLVRLAEGPNSQVNYYQKNFFSVDRLNYDGEVPFFIGYEIIQSKFLYTEVAARIRAEALAKINPIQFTPHWKEELTITQSGLLPTRLLIYSFDSTLDRGRDLEVESYPNFRGTFSLGGPLLDQLVSSKRKNKFLENQIEL